MPLDRLRRVVTLTGPSPLGFWVGGWPRGPTLGASCAGLRDTGHAFGT